MDTSQTPIDLTWQNPKQLNFDFKTSDSWRHIEWPDMQILKIIIIKTLNQSTGSMSRRERCVWQLRPEDRQHMDNNGQ